MPNCVVKGCNNYDTKQKKAQGISYHRHEKRHLNYRFPTDPDRKEIWNRIIRKQRRDPYFKPHKNSRVCSVHFGDEDISISKTGLRMLKVSAKPRLKIEPANDEGKQARALAEQNSKIEEIDVDIGDLNETFDTPKELHLKTKIERLTKRLKLAAKKMGYLRKQNARLKNKNKLLLAINKHLKQKKSVTVTENAKSDFGSFSLELCKFQELQNKDT